MNVVKMLKKVPIIGPAIRNCIAYEKMNARPFIGEVLDVRTGGGYTSPERGQRVPNYVEMMIRPNNGDPFRFEIGTGSKIESEFYKTEYPVGTKIRCPHGLNTVYPTKM